MKPDPLADITEDTYPARAILQELNDMGFETNDSQPGIISTKRETRAPTSLLLYGKSIVEAYNTKQSLHKVYAARGGTWFQKSSPEPSTKQRAYVCGYMPKKTARAVADLINRKDGFIAFTKSASRIPVTYQYSTHANKLTDTLHGPKGMLSGLTPAGTNFHISTMEGDDPPMHGKEFFVAIDACYGRLAYNSDGLFHVVRDAMVAVNKKIKH